MKLKRKLKKLRLSSLAGHTPDKRGERKDKYRNWPIEVRPLLFGGYRIIDGNDRVYYARERGDTHIWAEVLGE